MKKNKKLLLPALLALTLSLASCNEQIFDLNYQFEKAHLISVEKCVDIKSWRNYDDGDMVQITLYDDTIMLGHSREIILIKGECPYCTH